MFDFIVHMGSAIRFVRNTFGVMAIVITVVVCSSTVAQATTPENYLINVGDELELDILDDDDPPQRFTVGRDGSIQLPYIGSFKVASLSVSTARTQIQRAYVEREIFVDPSVELSIASFRPISVLGDVRSPGNFDFQPFMTAEQAVGLAGGPAISANNEEARVLERRDIEGRLSSLEYDLALAAARYARAQAQLQARDAVAWSDVPNDIRAGINRELFDEHKIKEDQVIGLDDQEVLTRRALLSDAASEARNRIDLLEQREAVLNQILDLSREELTRVIGMADRGLVTKSSVSEKDFEVSRAESQLLQLREQGSAARVQLAEIEGQLSQFDSEREKRLLTESQVFWSEINKLKSQRSTLEDRMRLLQQWMNAAAGLDTELLLEYQVRRRDGNGIRNEVIEPYEDLLPGDIVVIIVKSPETLKVGE